MATSDEFHQLSTANEPHTVAKDNTEYANDDGKRGLEAPKLASLARSGRNNRSCRNNHLHGLDMGHNSRVAAVLTGQAPVAMRCWFGDV